MEKFAVDLDAVLDEFEFHEGQAEKAQRISDPAASGFFSPVSETGPSSPDKLILSKDLNNGSDCSNEIVHNSDSTSETVHQQVSNSTRYDLPYVANQPVITPDLAEHDAKNEDSSVHDNNIDHEGKVDDTNVEDVKYAAGVNHSLPPDIKDCDNLSTDSLLEEEETPKCDLSQVVETNPGVDVNLVPVISAIAQQKRHLFPVIDEPDIEHEETGASESYQSVCNEVPVPSQSTCTDVPGSLPQDSAIIASLPPDSAILASLPQDRAILASLPQDSAMLESLPQDSAMVASLPPDSAILASLPQDSAMLAGIVPGTLILEPEPEKKSFVPTLTQQNDSHSALSGDVQLSPSKTLLEEMSEAAVTCDEAPVIVPASNSMVDSDPNAPVIVPGSNSKLAAFEDDYVDEAQLEEYLRQLELEANEEKIISDKDLAGSNSEQDDGFSEPTDAAGKVPTGARPKENSPFFQPGCEEDEAMKSVNNANFEEVMASITQPTIGVSGASSSHVYREDEVEYLDLEGADMQPSIGVPVPETLPTNPPAVPAESPPPYSEIDPMKVESRLNRPTSLDLPGTNQDGNPGTEALDQGEITEEEVSVSSENPVIGAPGHTPANPNGPRGGAVDLLAGLSEDQLMLGRIQPFWVPDNDAPVCMVCATKFTVVKRRHHCRACGKVLCSTCCNDKYKLVYMEGKEGRVCTPCKTILERLEKAEGASSQPATSSAVSRPNPANPMEYCSTVPVAEQASDGGPVPSVIVPVGVLKRTGSELSTSAGSKAQQENKSVMFSDGIRPGGDLTELDGGGEHRPLGRRSGRGKNRPRRGRGGPVGASDICGSMLPPEGLPLVSGKGKVDDEEVAVWLAAGTCVNFVLNKNLTVLVKRLLYPPVNKIVWNFASRGLTSVGQDDVAILLELKEDEQIPPRDVFTMLQNLYEQSGSGHPVQEMGHVSVTQDFLGSNVHGGWLFIRHTFQTVSDLLLPSPPLLFAILLNKWEVPWARVFPLRLMLRLGAESRYYPAPLVSVRGRKSVYGEIGHTIMNVLADFRNYAYSLPTIRGFVINMSPGRTSLLLPKNRYDGVVKALNNSNDPVLALGANFSMSADSHLVAIQGEDGSYQTQAINILNKERKVTGASFVVFNGALKSASGLTAKSSIVEDGLMVQVLPDRMVEIRNALRNMENHEIGCGPVGAEKPDEVVAIQWVDEDKAFNIGIKSVIDGRAMDGVSSLRIHSGPDMMGNKHLIRWTEVFLINTGEAGTPPPGDPPDPARASEGVARATCIALLPHLNQLKMEELTPVGVRVVLDQDKVGYEAGAGGVALPPVYMNSLDNELIPVLHAGAAGPGTGFTLELVFHILDH